ncbi:MAG: hypothetical protein ABSC56_01800 [Solirubrobacteraceae bacterium]|jgi:beta-mannosidase
MSRAADELLAGAAWTCAASEPGAVDDPAALADVSLDWLPFTPPGTAAGALRAAGRWQWGVADETELDGRDWWFRATFAAPEAGRWQLSLGGLATLADVWLNGEHLLRSESMFLAHSLAVELTRGNELVIRCAALDGAPAPSRPRARWKSRLVRSQSLRFRRTSLLGRMPGSDPWAAPVGPWRPLSLVPALAPAVVEQSLRASCVGEGGVVSVRLLVRGGDPSARATLTLGDSRAELEVAAESEGHWLLQGTLELGRVDRWWPHTHGPQPLYEVVLELGSERIALGRVGFRTIELDDADGGFALLVNGVRIFCRGGCWVPPDPVSLDASPAAVRRTVELARAAGMNMLRIAGYTCYEGPAFWDACDELGLLVWQDGMFASTDVPATAELVAATEAEVHQVFGSLAARPALAVACGSSETYQQAAMYGLAPGSFDCELLERTIPQALAVVAPGLPYVPSSPSGGEPPFTPRTGVAHYFGVGAYLRPPADARAAGVRFAGECLSFGTPPEPATIRAAFGSPALAGHHPRWKLGVARDAGTAWDFEDVVTHYVRELFDVDPLAVRYADPERALDLARAAVCELMCSAMSEWRRPGSSCDGAIILSLRDLWPGAGWGLIDALGRAKAPLLALRRVLSPTAVLLIDEGLAGLDVHVVHDRPEALRARLRLVAFNHAGVAIETAERDVELASHGALALRAEDLLGGFRDVTRAYRFGPAPYDVIAVTAFDESGCELARACYLPQGPSRPQLPDLGLRARATQSGDGAWELELSTRLFAHYVAVDVDGFEPSDGWFHMLPGERVALMLHPETTSTHPVGSVRALNGPAVPISIER